jgi:flagellin-specific chaperone FliS
MYQASVQNKINPYLVNEILTASPERLLIKAFDFAIVHSEKKEMLKTNNAIQELIGMLRFDDENFKELSINLLRLYHFCQDQTRKNNFSIVTKILTELRESWLSIIENK